MTALASVGHGTTSGHGSASFERLSPAELAALRERIAALPLDQAGEVLDAAAARLKAAADVPAVARAAVPPGTAAAPAGPTLVDAKTVAESLGVAPAWVWSHADELGAIRLGDGPRPRLRFDLERALAAAAARHGRERSVPPNPAPPQAIRRRRDAATAGGAPLLPIRGPQEVRDAA